MSLVAMHERLINCTSCCSLLSLLQLLSDYFVPVFTVFYPEDCRLNRTWTLVENLDVPACKRSERWAMVEDALPPQNGNRQGVCIQGTMDPARRDYMEIFADIWSRSTDLLASGFQLVVQGKGGGKGGAAIMEVPRQLIESGLVKHYSLLPFQVKIMCISASPCP
jgi:hypothetical protein